jgi:glycosyltransferase involved in cell wall biosynthesis
MERVDPRGECVAQSGFVEHDRVPELLAAADLCVFASSCENMPNTLLEAMAAGLPIASSDRGPMPEILKDGGVYCDPESPRSIASAIEKIITDEQLRISIAARAKEISEIYSWAKCANETWEFLREIAMAPGYDGHEMNSIRGDVSGGFSRIPGKKR